jgi:N-methylhydantoinase A/oxoprolinase/acetone carboxylase beta subunit
MYDLVLKPETPVFLAPGRFRKEVIERLDAQGNVLVALDESSVRTAVAELLALDVQAIAVSLVFSFLDPTHERRVREIIAEIVPGLPVSISSDVDPAFREYERTCVTAFDAYIKPVVAEYLANLEAGLSKQKPLPLRLPGQSCS